MKTQVLRIAVVVTGLLMVSSALAQSKPGDVLVNVPFSFIVNNHQMPAGRYVVTPATYGVLRIFDTENSRNQLFMGVHSVQSSKTQTPKLVFHRYGDSYFLSEVWNGQSNIGKQLPPSKAEKEIASEKRTGGRTNGEVAVVRPER